MKCTLGRDMGHYVEPPEAQRHMQDTLVILQPSNKDQARVNSYQPLLCHFPRAFMIAMPLVPNKAPLVAAPFRSYIVRTYPVCTWMKTGLDLVLLSFTLLLDAQPKLSGSSCPNLPPVELQDSRDQGENPEAILVWTCKHSLLMGANSPNREASQQEGARAH
uniref:Uncharacterized protein n=1 Tax=Sphaerodactylus townsendi TaxID=933632 RepID=A0ACB8EAF2_9SAUR